MAAARFTRGAARPAPAPAPAQRESKYAGISASIPRDPMPSIGEYRFKVEDCREGYNKGTCTESFKITLRIVEIFSGGVGHAVGDTVFVVFLTSGPAAIAGLPRVVAFCAATAGFDPTDAAGYDEFDPERLYVEACSGKANTYSEAVGGVNPVIGAVVDCAVTRGKDTPTGDYYREYAWTQGQV